MCSNAENFETRSQHGGVKIQPYCEFNANAASRYLGKEKSTMFRKPSVFQRRSVPLLRRPVQVAFGFPLALALATATILISDTTAHAGATESVATADPPGLEIYSLADRSNFRRLENGDFMFRLAHDTESDVIYWAYMGSTRHVIAFAVPYSCGSPICRRASDAALVLSIARGFISYRTMPNSERPDSNPMPRPSCSKGRSGTIHPEIRPSKYSRSPI